jgi:hypothetical protein
MKTRKKIITILKPSFFFKPANNTINDFGDLEKDIQFKEHELPTSEKKLTGIDSLNKDVLASKSVQDNSEDELPTSEKSQEDITDSLNKDVLASKSVQDNSEDELPTSEKPQEDITDSLNKVVLASKSIQDNSEDKQPTSEKPQEDITDSLNKDALSVSSFQGKSKSPIFKSPSLNRLPKSGRVVDSTELKLSRTRSNKKGEVDISMQITGKEFVKLASELDLYSYKQIFEISEDKVYNLIIEATYSAEDMVKKLLQIKKIKGIVSSFRTAVENTDEIDVGFKEFLSQDFREKLNYNFTNETIYMIILNNDPQVYRSLFANEILPLNQKQSKSVAFIKDCLKDISFNQQVYFAFKKYASIQQLIKEHEKIYNNYGEEKQDESC